MLLKGLEGCLPLGEKSVNPVATQKKGRQGYDQANHAKSRRKQAEQVCNFS
jgi:hypothetical protein